MIKLFVVLMLLSGARWKRIPASPPYSPPARPPRLAERMDDPPTPGSPSSRAPQHSREPSHTGSFFSEHNPLSGDNPAPLPQPPKKPKAVALHGWQRTVGVDEDFDPTIPVCLGAPGTGLYPAKPGGQSNNNNPPGGGAGGAGGAAAPALGGVGTVFDLGNAKVTRADKREAKSLRLQPALPDAAPLPYPRVAAVDSDGSETSSSAADGDGDDPARRPGGEEEQQQQQLYETQSCSSVASSDMSFLVNATSGSYLSGRQTFGRKIDPRIPATVGEECLHNSLAQYFGKSRRNITAGGTGTGGVEESKGGDSRPFGGPAAAGTGGGTELLVPRGIGAGSSSAPVDSTHPSAATPEGGGDGGGGDGGGDTISAALLASGGSASTVNTSTSAASVALAVQQHYRRSTSSTGNKEGVKTSGTGGGRTSGTWGDRISGTWGGGGGGGGDGGKNKGAEEESKKRESSSRFGGGSKAAMLEEGRLAKAASVSGSEAVVEPGRRAPTCSCWRRWPWKVIRSELRKI